MIPHLCKYLTGCLHLALGFRRGVCKKSDLHFQLPDLPVKLYREGEKNLLNDPITTFNAKNTQMHQCLWVLW